MASRLCMFTRTLQLDKAKALGNPDLTGTFTACFEQTAVRFYRVVQMSRHYFCYIRRPAPTFQAVPFCLNSILRRATQQGLNILLFRVSIMRRPGPKVLPVKICRFKLIGPQQCLPGVRSVPDCVRSVRSSFRAKRWIPRMEVHGTIK